MQFPLTASTAMRLRVLFICSHNKPSEYILSLTMAHCLDLYSPAPAHCQFMLNYCKSLDSFPAPLSLWLQSLFLSICNFSSYTVPNPRTPAMLCFLSESDGLLLGSDGFLDYLSTACAQVLAQELAPNKCLLNVWLNESINKTRKRKFCHFSYNWGKENSKIGLWV